MVNLQGLIKRGKVGGLSARGALNEISLDNVASAQSEILTKRNPDGSILRYTVLKITLDGKELRVNNNRAVPSAAAESNSDDVMIMTQDGTQGQVEQMIKSQDMSSRGELPGIVAREELEEYKKTIQIKAEKCLQRQLNKHNLAHEQNLENARNNYRNILHASLHAVTLKEKFIALSKITIHLPPKTAAEIARYDSKLWKDYQDLCCRELKSYQADLKRQYRDRLDDIESECREWLQNYAGSSLNFDGIDGPSNTIAQAAEFDAQLPDLNGPTEKVTTGEEIEDIQDELEANFWEEAQKDVRDGGMAFRLEDVQLEPLFDDIPEPNFGQNTSMVGVPAALLPLYQSTSKISVKQTSAALRIIERNNTSNHSTTQTENSNGFQAQEWTRQYFPTNNFTPINKPYVSPYAAELASKSSQNRPISAPSLPFYGPKDRVLAERTRASSAGEDAVPNKSTSIGRIGSGDQPKLPLAGVFTISQPVPRRIAPTRIASPRQVDEDLGDGDEIPRPSSAISRSNIISVSRRSAHVSIDPNTYVVKSLYAADYEEEEDEDFIPPPTSPQKPQTRIDRYKSIESAAQQHPRYDPNTYVDESLYDADYESPPPLTIPQNHHRLKTEPSMHTKNDMISMSARKPNPWMRDTLRGPFDDGSGDLADYKPCAYSDLPEIEDFDGAEADTSIYLGRSAEGNREVIYISSDDENEESGLAVGNGNVRRASDTHGPMSNYYVPEPDFGYGDRYQHKYEQAEEHRGNDDPSSARKTYTAPIIEPVFNLRDHVDPHANQRAPRPLQTKTRFQWQSILLAQNSNPNLNRGNTVVSTHASASGSVRSTTNNSERALAQRRFKGKTVKQIMLLLKAEEDEKKRERDDDVDDGGKVGGNGGVDDGDGDDLEDGEGRGAKRRRKEFVREI